MDAQHRDKITNELMIYHMKVIICVCIYLGVVLTSDIECSTNAVVSTTTPLPVPPFSFGDYTYV